MKYFFCFVALSLIVACLMSKLPAEVGELTAKFENGEISKNQFIDEIHQLINKQNDEGIIRELKELLNEVEKDPSFVDKLGKHLENFGNTIKNQVEKLFGWMG